MLEILAAVLLFPIAAVIWAMALCLAYLMYKTYIKEDSND